MPPLRSRSSLVLHGAMLVALVALTFALSIRGAFLWDDDAHITSNPCIVGPLGLREIWTTSAANYFPFVLTNFWVQHALWGINPAGYHVVTIAFHAATVVMLWLVLSRLEIPGAWLGAAIWAVHPIQVESVAWICELKNTQSGFFFFLSLWCFLRWSDGSSAVPRSAQPSQPSDRWAYVMALLCALAAILSKPSTVTLPFVLLLCWWWTRRRVSFAAALRLAPFFAVSAVASLWTIWEQKFHSGAIGAEWNQSMTERIAIALRVPWFYVGKLLWPDLSFVYPRWNHFWGPALLCLVATAMAGALLWRFRKTAWGRGALFAVAYFIALLVPVLGFFSIYYFRYSFVADHFQYLASVGPIALAAAAGARLWGKHSRLLGAAALSVAAVGAAQRCTVFRNNERLWTNTLASTPTATLAITQLGAMDSLRGQHDRAMARYQQALGIDPDDFYAHNGIGCELLAAGRPHEAVAELHRAVQIDPRDSDGHNNLGRALQDCGELAEARIEYEQALRLRPNNTNAHVNLGTLLVQTGHAADAIHHYNIALEKHPNDAQVHQNLGTAWRELGRLQDAVIEYRIALKFQPLAETHDDLGSVLESLGRTGEATAEYQAALKLNPTLGTALAHLAATHITAGLKLARTGQLSEALDEFNAAVAVAPTLSAAHLNRGIALAQLGRWAEAKDAFARAVALDEKSSAAHQYLGVALATTGALKDGAVELETALRLNPESAEARASYARVLAALGQNARPNAGTTP